MLEVCGGKMGPQFISAMSVVEIGCCNNVSLSSWFTSSVVFDWFPWQSSFANSICDLDLSTSSDTVQGDWTSLLPFTSEISMYSILCVSTLRWLKLNSYRIYYSLNTYDSASLEDFHHRGTGQFQCALKNNFLYDIDDYGHVDRLLWVAIFNNQQFGNWATVTFKDVH